MSDRLVALVDMDCFYCQVETRLNPALKGKPMAVVQYNQWKGGGIIAVNYEARDRGVTRHMRGDEAKKHCPEIQLVSVPAVRGKADLTKYRDAGREVVKVICEFSECVQRASVDEAYIDFTDSVEARLAAGTKVRPTLLENTFVVGYTSEDNNDEDEREAGVKAWLQDVYSTELRDRELHKLATAAALVEEMRAAVYEKTGFRCSAGISHNKILAKLVCGLHKPNRQTVLPMASVAELYRTLPVKKVRNLGGKLGDDLVQTLCISYMAELANFTETQLQTKYDDKTGTWLYNIARGIDLDPVTPQLITKSIGCRKNFPGKTALRTRQNVTHWISELAAEVAERLDEDLHMNKRRANLLTVHFAQEMGKKDVAMSRSMSFPGYETEKIAACAFNVLAKYNSSPPTSDLWEPPLKYLGISTGKFVEISGDSGSIDKFFKPGPSTSKTQAASDKCQNDLWDTKIPKGTNAVDETSNLRQENSETYAIRPKKQSSDSNKTLHNKGSFFERYFINQPDKIIKKDDTIKIPKNDMRVPTRNKICKGTDLPGKSNSEQSAKLTPNSLSAKKNTTQTSELKHVVNNYKISESKNESEELNENNSEGSFISLSEIFPDLENIDDSIINILPSPLQIKISTALKSKSESKLRHILQESEGGSGVSRASTNSDCAPTIVETEAEIHGLTQVLTMASTSKSNYVQNNCAVKYDAIEADDLFNKTSLDIFKEEPSESFEDTKSVGVQWQEVVYDKCSYCQESIPIIDLTEHIDHHVAIQLHEQLNKQSKPTTLRTNNSNEIRQKKNVGTILNGGKKRGRPSKKDSVVTKKMKTIVSFFTKS